MASLDVDPGLGLLLSVVIPLGALSLYKFISEFDKGTLREYKLIDRTPAGRAINTLRRISQRISGGRPNNGGPLPVVAPRTNLPANAQLTNAGERPQSFTQRMSMALGAAKDKFITVNYSPKSLNNTGILARLKRFSKRRVGQEMTVLQLSAILLYAAIALFWVYAEIGGFLVADAWGYVCISSALMVVIPATRNSLLTYFLMAPFERTIAYHRWLGTFVFIAGAMHTIYYLVEWTQDGTFEDNLDDEKYQLGFVAMAGLTTVFITSRNRVRRSAYSVFRFSHYAFFVFFIAGVAHTEEFLIYAVIAGVIYFSDIFLRYAFDLTPKQAFAIDVLPGEVTRIRFPKSAFKSYSAGQYVFINLPDVSRSEWHPFTLSSGPNQDYLEVHVKALGDFTTQVLAAGQSMSSMKQLPKIRVDGPYGRIAFNYKRYESIVLVGGGVGVTPMMSVLKDLFQIDVSEDNRRRYPISPYVKNVYFLWVVPSVAPWAWFFDTLKVAMATSATGSALGYPKLRVKGFCTKPDPKLAKLQRVISPIKDYHITEGRPNMPQLIEGIESSIGEGRKRVAVLACGPSKLVSSTWDTCLKRSRPGIQFDCHREEFEF